jgi:ABC-2 type transport system ATP-binding protein
MRRRLDIAASIVVTPRLMFLDEPTTGLDPQSRAALWEEVERLSREEGMTVFLTTQYLEEADALAARVGIIDSGRIVAEGTPAELKAEIGDPGLEAVPADAGRREDMARVLERFGDGECVHHEHGSLGVRLRGGDAALAGVVRALDAEGIGVATLQLHAPTLDDVFLAKTGRSLEGAGDDELGTDLSEEQERAAENVPA